MSAAAGAETEASAASDTVYGDSVLGTEVDEERKEGDQGEGVGENDSTRRDTDYEMKDVTTAHKECEDSSTSSTTAAATGEMKAQPPPHIRSMAYDSEDDDSDQRRNLIVNYIPQDMSDEEFSRLFTPFGALLSYKVVRNKSTGHSLEYGFVKFESAAAAERAIRELNGKRVRTKVIKVAHARPQSVELRFANVYVSNLEPTATSEDLRDLFSSYGKVLDIKILTNKETNRSRGVAFVRYEKRTEAENAILSLKGYRSPKISSRGLEVKIAANSRAGGASNRNGFGPQGGYHMMGMGGSGGYGPYGQMRYNPMGYGYPMGQAGIGGMMPQYPQQMIPGMAGPGMMLPGSGFQGYCIFVYNIPQEADESFLFELFKRFGTVSSIRVMRDQQMKSKGFGFANMLSLMEAQRAISALNGVEVCGKKLQVSFKK